MSRLGNLQYLMSDVSPSKHHGCNILINLPIQKGYHFFGFEKTEFVEVGRYNSQKSHSTNSTLDFRLVVNVLHVDC